MSETNKIKVQVSGSKSKPSLETLKAQSRAAAAETTVYFRKNIGITLQSLTESINESELDDYTKVALIKKAASYPHSALQGFRKNINKYITKIQSDRNKI